MPLVAFVPSLWRGLDVLNICMCGTQDGYPHPVDCPYPLYRGGAAEQQRWEAARDARLSCEHCPADGGGCGMCRPETGKIATLAE